MVLALWLFHAGSVGHDLVREDHGQGHLLLSTQIRNHGCTKFRQQYDLSKSRLLGDYFLIQRFDAAYLEVLSGDWLVRSVVKHFHEGRYEARLCDFYGTDDASVRRASPNPFRGSILLQP
ncbi:hypothetical protein ONS95_011420 [Cadophora gregata]|uniref:uncharacterized protein n=1 Tax=Cadophora gregata TaxID=51156 RepID=UPI0026DC0D07|nr:uncharacterized protein ONS95_011420 [Cadophora gregata]KAK0120002.1 hypothetical protein ONS95_011420 [Cadophora gregata]KAK0121037.1 hypothetical protein ONS96_011224 [Cadophora gregata f. sp. sojae]